MKVFLNLFLAFLILFAGTACALPGEKESGKIISYQQDSKSDEAELKPNRGHFIGYGIKEKGRGMVRSLKNHPDYFFERQYNIDSFRKLPNSGSTFLISKKLFSYHIYIFLHSLII